MSISELAIHVFFNYKLFSFTWNQDIILLKKKLVKKFEFKFFKYRTNTNYANVRASIYLQKYARYLWPKYIYCVLLGAKQTCYTFRKLLQKTILFCQISTQKINIFCNFEIYLIKILTWFTGDVGGLYILFIVE